MTSLSSSKKSNFFKNLASLKPNKIKLAQQYNRLKEEKRKFKRTAERQQQMLKKFSELYLATIYKMEQLDHQMIDIKKQIEEDPGDSRSQETFIDLTL